MPLTTSATDQAVYKIVQDTAKYYMPGSTNSKPMHKLENLFVQAINSNQIQTNIMDYMLSHLSDYE